MTDALVAFLSARLDEDEAAAKAAAQSESQWASGDVFAPEWRHVNRTVVVESDAGFIVFDEGAPSDDQVAHIARHDPARVLREVGAKRAILGMHHPTEPHPEFGFTYPDAAKFCGWCGPGDNWQAEREPDMFPFALWPCTHARTLAAVYSDHPDYQGVVD